jgi:hypothetical protein
MPQEMFYGNSVGPSLKPMKQEAECLRPSMFLTTGVHLMRFP